MRSKLIQNGLPSKHLKMNDFGTILEFDLEPKIDQKSTLFSAVFLDASKSCAATILSSKQSPKWNQF